MMLSRWSLLVEAGFWSGTLLFLDLLLLPRALQLRTWTEGQVVAAAAFAYACTLVAVDAAYQYVSTHHIEASIPVTLALMGAFTGVIRGASRWQGIHSKGDKDGRAA